jgi:molybdenum cofactor cytidylyltransferase
MIYGLIPAAGKSKRMGRPKLLLPFRGRTVLEHTITVFTTAGIEHVLMVVGPDDLEQAALAARSGAHVFCLEKSTPDMRSTVEFGLGWIEAEFNPSAGDFWLLAPADHPTLDEKSVEQLIQAAARSASFSIFIPTFNGARGHPVLINWKHVSGIRGFTKGVGINAWLREQSRVTLLVPVDSAEVLVDLDTPEDYERLLRRSNNLAYPHSSPP